MKVTLVSDLHNECGYMPLKGGEVLVVAGDLCEAHSLHHEFHSTKVVGHGPGRYPCWDMLEYEFPKYDKVFYVMGNHEHYRGRFDKTYDLLKSLLPANTTLLENEVAEYNGVMFMGATLWTNLNNNDPITAYTVRDYMNDFRLIKHFYKDANRYGKLIPEYTAGIHRKTVEYFAQQLKENADKKFFVITHHAPSEKSVHESYRKEYHVNGAYFSNLENFILDNPNITHWVHGHMHNQFDYMIGDTRIVCNPRGYPGENPKYKPLDILI